MDLPLENPDLELVWMGVVVWIKDKKLLDAVVTHQLLSTAEDIRNWTVCSREQLGPTVQRL